MVKWHLDTHLHLLRGPKTHNFVHCKLHGSGPARRTPDTTATSCLNIGRHGDLHKVPDAESLDRNGGVLTI